MSESANLIKTLEIADLREGDVILSSKTLVDILSLMELQGYLYLQNQIWRTADSIISLINYLEAFITQNRVIFPVNKKVNLAAIHRDNIANFELNLLLLDDKDYQASLGVIDKVQTYIPAVMEGYLSQFIEAKEELERYNDFFHKAKWVFVDDKEGLKEVDKTGWTIKAEAWDEIIKNRSLTFFSDYLISVYTNTPFYASGLESSFVSSVTSNIDAAKTSINIIQKSRIPHAIKTNKLLKRELFDYEVPFIFGAILANSSSWADVFTVAKDIRATREAIEFRKWISSIKLDLTYHANFAELDELSFKLATSINAKDKNKKYIDSEIDSYGIDSSTANTGYMRFLNDLFYHNKAIVKIDDQISRVLNANQPCIFGPKIVELSRGCNIKVDEINKTLSLSLRPIVTEQDVGRGSSQFKFESNFYGTVYGPIHTGTGNIYIKDNLKSGRKKKHENKT